jgi:3-phosphoshikimate 1-carboxyvinyltransferase
MVLNIKFKFYGIETLFKKETDRVFALQTECKKAGFELIQKDNYLKWNGEKTEIENYPVFETYNDHRMALSLSLFVYLYPKIEIINPEVVNKSFPKYWGFMNHLGIEITDYE